MIVADFRDSRYATATQHGAIEGQITMRLANGFAVAGRTSRASLHRGAKKGDSRQPHEADVGSRGKGSGR